MDELLKDDWNWWKEQITVCDFKIPLVFYKKCITTGNHLSSNHCLTMEKPIFTNVDDRSSPIHYIKYKKLNTLLPSLKRKLKNINEKYDLSEPIFNFNNIQIPTMIKTCKIKFPLKEKNCNPHFFYKFNCSPLLLNQKQNIKRNPYKIHKRLVNIGRINEKKLLIISKSVLKFEYKNLINDYQTPLDTLSSINFPSSPLLIEEIPKRHAILNRKALQYIPLIDYLSKEDIEIHERDFFPIFPVFISEPGCINLFWNHDDKDQIPPLNMKISRIFIEKKRDFIDLEIMKLKIRNPSLEIVIISREQPFKDIPFSALEFMDRESSWERFISAWKKIDPWKCQLEFISKDEKLEKIFSKASKHCFNS